MDNVPSNLRDMVVTPGTGKDVKDTQQLSGVAADSLSGKNSTTQYENAGGCSGDGPWGGMNKGK
tara:strand:- start:361 stop:552 length:192 start_codon:yes stop_codon:yes gene_type:complete